MRLTTDPQRLLADLEQLAEFREPDEQSSTRRVFSSAYRDGRDWIAERMRDAGLAVSVDEAGNLIGRLDGAIGGPPIVTGSHSDTVRGGGRFDGTLGVLAGIEVARALSENERRLRHPLWVVDFLGEEPNGWGLSCLGSRAATGGLTKDDLGRVDSEGNVLREVMQRWGLDPDKAVRSQWANPCAFVELHIEQGPLLEAQGCAIGVVTGIVGVYRALVEFAGRRDHSGTTPMDRRSDAACAAAEMILAVERVARAGGVGTTGRLEVEPGSINIVPDRARVWVELRSVDQQWLDSAISELSAAAVASGSARGVSVSQQELSREAPTTVDRVLQQQVRQAALDHGYRVLELASGAEHDARQMARICPMAMVFVPSVAGRSHSPAELTHPGDLAAGLQTLATTIMKIDAAGSAHSN